MTTLDVLVLDDSAICLARLRTVLQADGDIRVVASLDDGSRVLSTLADSKPDVLVTDLMMPRVGGLDVVRAVMRSHPVPILVVSMAGFTQTSAFETIRLGALEVATKPDLGDHLGEAALREAVRRLARVPVIRHPGEPQRASREREAEAAQPTWRGPSPRIIGIGASAGGPPAIVDLLRALPRKALPPIVVAQHLPRGHTGDFAAFLARRCEMAVHICTTTVTLEPDVVVVPGDGLDLTVLDRRRATAVPANRTLTPSVDALLASLASTWGPGAAGVVLSGIGNDGASGLAAIRTAGGLTCAQDQASSAVYGMPRAAASAAHFHLAPARIATVLAQAGRLEPPLAS